MRCKPEVVRRASYELRVQVGWCSSRLYTPILRSEYLSIAKEDSNKAVDRILAKEHTALFKEALDRKRAANIDWNFWSVLKKEFLKEDPGSLLQCLVTSAEI